MHSEWVAWTFLLLSDTMQQRLQKPAEDLPPFDSRVRYNYVNFISIYKVVGKKLYNKLNWIITVIKDTVFVFYYTLFSCKVGYKCKLGTVPVFLTFL